MARKVMCSGAITIATVLLLQAAMAPVNSQDIRENEVGSNREPRYGIIKGLLPYINLRINNPFECIPNNTTADGATTVGTCMSMQDCATAGGRVEGECLDGYGRCCILEADCGSTIERNRTYIVSNSTETSGTFSCQYNIKKLKEDSIANSLLGACQVRLDFEQFSLAQPDDQTVCTTDSFEVTGNANMFGKICGENTGQHIYLPIGVSDNVATVSIQGGTSSIARGYRIKVTYIPCLSNVTAPDGCLQYFPDASGTITSFNYLESPTGTDPSQIGNLDYSICVGNAQTYCKTTFGEGETTTFSLTGDASAATGTAAVTAANCLLDYMAFTVQDDTGAPSDNSVFCGTKFDSVSTTARPVVVKIHTDGTEPTTDVANNGFALTYTSEAC